MSRKLADSVARLQYDIALLSMSETIEPRRLQQMLEALDSLVKIFAAEAKDVRKPMELTPGDYT